MINGQFAAWRGGPQGGTESGHGGGIGGGPGGGYFGHTGGGEGGSGQLWSAAVRKVDAGGYQGVGQHQFHGGPHFAGPHAGQGPHPADAHFAGPHAGHVPHPAGPHPVHAPHHGSDFYPAGDGHHVPYHVDAAPQVDHGVGQPHPGAAKVGYYGSTHAPQDGPPLQHVDHAPYWH
jgi:hypothetical protein